LEQGTADHGFISHRHVMGIMKSDKLLAYKLGP
jgi:hypothetical protein